jgi:hypothetical protein
MLQFLQTFQHTLQSQFSKMNEDEGGSEPKYRSHSGRSDVQHGAVQWEIVREEQVGCTCSLTISHSVFVDLHSRRCGDVCLFEWLPWLCVDVRCGLFAGASVLSNSMIYLVLVESLGAADHWFSSLWCSNIVEIDDWPYQCTCYHGCRGSCKCQVMCWGLLLIDLRVVIILLSGLWLMWIPFSWVAWKCSLPFPGHKEYMTLSFLFFWMAPDSHLLSVGLTIDCENESDVM